MIEIPETVILANQLKETVVNKTIENVLPPTKKHKFCWFNGEPSSYAKAICNEKIIDASYFGIYVEMVFSNGLKLCINDGINIRYEKNLPKDYQMAIAFDDDTFLVFSVAMYGGIILHDGAYDNIYYQKSKEAIPFTAKEFDIYYDHIFNTSKENLSMKAFLASEQRFPGIGNGVLQDILFIARINPKRKKQTITKEEKNQLLISIKNTLREMIINNGRDSEKDLFGNKGEYQVIMSKNNKECPVCGKTIIKETFLGGSIYYCNDCQK